MAAEGTSTTAAIAVTPIRVVTSPTSAVTIGSDAAKRDANVMNEMSRATRMPMASEFPPAPSLG